MQEKPVKIEMQVKIMTSKKKNLNAKSMALPMSYKPPHLKNRITKETNFDLHQESITIFSLYTLSNLCKFNVYAKYWL